MEFVKWNHPQPKTYYDVKLSKKPIVVNQGGARSGKTFSTLQVLIEFCKANEGAGFIISVVRKTTPALKATAYRDFIDILIKEEWYSETFHNKSSMEYNLFGNLVEFFAIDQPQKVRGRRRHICFINEANELSYDEFLQLRLRTEFKIICDFNPSDEFHWLYELQDKLGVETVDFFVTNFMHNPHIPKGNLETILSLKDADPDYWKVFGLGERGASRELVFNHWKECEALPGVGDCVVYGQDFGFNVPSALVKVEILENEVYAQELIYKPGLITSDLSRIYTELGLDFSCDIYADAAEPDRIEELCRMGFDVRPAKKDVLEGINKLKSMKLFVTSSSVNLIKELRNYKWKKDAKTDRTEDEVVKFNDHAIDALRYAVYSHASRSRRMRSFSISPISPN